MPHHPEAVIVSMDEDAQELRIIADYSKDPNMVACFVGDHKKKMHALTGLGILKTWDAKYANWDYDMFMAAYKEHDAELIKAYMIGKKVNFTTEYGAQAPKVA